MPIPCSILCLLALLLNFMHSSDIQKCFYCVEIRGLTRDCKQKPWSCAERDPDSLIYCLNRDEQLRNSDRIKRSVRCISHSNLLNQSLLIPMDVLQKLELIPATGHQQQCTFDLTEECQCPDCIEQHGNVNVSSEVTTTETLVEKEKDGTNKSVEDVLANELQQSGILLDKQEQVQKKFERGFLANRKPLPRSNITAILSSVSQRRLPLPTISPLTINDEVPSNTKREAPSWSLDFLNSGTSTSNRFGINIQFVIFLCCLATTITHFALS